MPTTPPDERTVLLRYLREARESLVWKLDGLGERDVRRPLTATGTNLLGLVKHCAGIEIGYFGSTFGREWPGGEPAWLSEDAPANTDMWATADEPADDLVALYRSVWAFADELLENAPLDTLGRVPWWPAERATVTLRQIAMHVATELSRHAGHADIVRELVDGAAGLRPAAPNLPGLSAEGWSSYVARLQAVADSFEA